MSSLVRWRVLLAGLAGCGCVGLVMLSRHKSQTPVLGPYSPAALAALVLTAAAVLVLLGLVLAPRRHLRRCEAKVRGLVQWLASREPTMSHLGVAGLLVFAVASYGVLTARFFALNRAPAGDQREYLLLAQQIEQSAPIQLIGADYREANRHPLYPVILAWTGASEIDPIAFARGKCTSVGLAWLAFAVLITLVARRFSPAVAAITAVLLATNLAWLRFTTLVACEGLLILWTGLLWLSAAAGPSPGGADAQSPSPSSPGLTVARPSRWFALGAWAGLAYLTKGSALLLVLGLIVWLIVRRDSPFRLAGGGRKGGHEGNSRSTQGAARSIALVLGAWLLVASPLLVRNARVYGNPLYNSNSPFLFSDSFEEALRRSDPSRPANENESTWAAARRYFRTHSAGQVLARAATGSATELFILLRALGPSPLGESRALVGAPILLLALLGMAALRRRDAVLVLIWIGLFLLFFGWYVPIAAGDRFVLPLVPPIYVYAASTLGRLAGARGKRGAATAVVFAAAAWTVLCVGSTLVITSVI